MSLNHNSGPIIMSLLDTFDSYLDLCVKDLMEYSHTQNVGRALRA